TLEGIVTRAWQDEDREPAVTKEGVLTAWDDDTKRIDALWSQIPAGRLQEDDVAFGQWPGKTYWILMYVIDNEIHHRAQGYVYLRALGIEPPAFYER
ncbi:MAG TPA: DinB family protein, partial [Trueperaceae bacterium]|nr:DinB family protein [Trueperaceae bacterium]